MDRLISTFLKMGLRNISVWAVIGFIALADHHEAHCPSPPQLAHGTYHCPSTDHTRGQVCTLTCGHGFMFTNSSNRNITCRSDSTWTVHSGCALIKCPSPPKVTNGGFNCNTQFIRTCHTTNTGISCSYVRAHGQGQTCHLHCNKGYKPSNTSKSIRCGSQATWSTPGSCIEIRCPDPPKVSNGVYQCAKTANYKLDDVCHLHCSPGFGPSSSSSDIKCLSSDEWSLPAICLESRCPPPPAVTDGVYLCAHSDNPNVPETCHLHCSVGFRPTSSSTDITCLSTKKWSVPSTCVEIKCPSPPKVTNGAYRCSGHTSTHKLNDECYLHCNTGFKPSSSSSDIRCQSSDKWSTPSTCFQTKCPAPPKVKNGWYQCDNTPFYMILLHHTQLCHLHCEIGFKPSTILSSIECLSTNKWSTAATCTEVLCHAPPTVVNGMYHCFNSTHKLGEKCQLQCNHGYKPSSISSDTVCLGTDKWSSQASCVEIQCPEPPKVHNGIYHCRHATNKLNDLCQLQCDAGFKPNHTYPDIMCLPTSQWSNVATCVEIQCPAPPKVHNGMYHCDHATNKLNDVCQLQCDAGFKPNNTYSDIRCQPTSQWSAVATCVEKECPAPPRVTNGVYHCAKTPYRVNDVCHLQCASGYKPTTSSRDIRCRSVERWSGGGACIEIQCHPPAKVHQGEYHCSSAAPHKLNDVCQLQCNHGYRPSTSSPYIHCLTSGTWSSQSLCTEILCHAPPTVTDGAYHCSNTTTHKFGDTCQLQCNHGYKPSSNSTDIHCLADDLWSPLSYCVGIQCPAPPSVYHGAYHCNSSAPHGARLDDSCHLQCDKGYTPTSVGSTINCLSSEEWSHHGYCVEILCHAPPNVVSGVYQCSNSTPYKLGETCQLQCHHGYKPSSISSDIHCLATDKWSPQTSCVEIQCPAPPAVYHGAYQCNSSTPHGARLDDSCHLHCEEGYTPTSVGSTINCLSSEKWSHHGYCVEILCNAPPNVVNGMYHCSNSTTHKLGEICSLRCNHGYKTSSASSDIHCLSAATWSTPASCIEIQCPIVPFVAKGVYHCGSSPIQKLNDVCHLKCEDGYKPYPDSTDIHCLLNETWSTPSACIERKCPPPPMVTSGEYHCGRTSYKINDVCHLKCNPGFRPLSAFTDILCLPTETWSTLESCIAV